MFLLFCIVFEMNACTFCSKKLRSRAMRSEWRGGKSKRNIMREAVFEAEKSNLTRPNMLKKSEKL